MRVLLNFISAFIARVSRLRIAVWASSLAYYATFSLFPLLLLAVAVFGFALERNPDLRETALNILSKAIETAFPTASDLLNSTLLDLKKSLLERVQLGASISGIIGLVTLVWASSGFFTALQGALNEAIPGARARPVWMSQIVAIATIAVFGVLLTLFILSGLIISTIASLSGLGFLESVTGPIPTILSVTIIFSLAYRCLPAHAPGWRSSIIAGTLTALTWQGARSGLGLLTPVATYQASYGVLAGFLLLLSWLYLSMHIFLMGAVLAGIIEQTDEKITEVNSDA